MQQILNTLSRLLEAGRPTLTADDLAELDEPASRVLLAQQLLVPARTATHVVCDACHDDHLEEVVRIKDAKGEVTFRIRCPDAGWVVVPAERLRQWTIDVRRLVSLLGEGVGSNDPPVEVVSGSVWRVGSVEIGGALLGLTFVLNGAGTDESVLDEVAKKVPPAQTILIGICDLPAAAGFAAAVSLTSAFEFADGRSELQWDHIRSAVSSGATIQGNVFQRRGEFWQLSFEGETKYFKDSVGLGYIARLLMEPGRDVPAVTLLAARAGIDPLVATGSSGIVLDDQARDEYGRRYREIQEELHEANENNDLGQIEKLQGEMETLTTELAGATGLGGRNREATDADRVRKSVSMAVSRGIEQVGKEHAALGRHLTASISSGLVFRYSPEREVNWLI